MLVDAQGHVVLARTKTRRSRSFDSMGLGITTPTASSSSSTSSSSSATSSSYSSDVLSWKDQPYRQDLPLLSCGPLDISSSVIWQKSCPPLVDAPRPPTPVPDFRASARMPMTPPPFSDLVMHPSLDLDDSDPSLCGYDGPLTLRSQPADYETSLRRLSSTESLRGFSTRVRSALSFPKSSASSNSTTSSYRSSNRSSWSAWMPKRKPRGSPAVDAHIQTLPTRGSRGSRRH